jgi:DNA-binding CsgD family transcriptional regulator
MDMEVAGDATSASSPSRSRSCGPRSTPAAANHRSRVSSLAAAELRLLPLLPTQLTFAEIGERLSVSHHTVKSQAMSVYR